ncbi:MAG: hypothetical protein NUV69_05105 [Candidatus Curtissbacteria bacterium]|nr:hypothetical protein [Candidatus Curtissbacteria bacterium]
MQQTELKFKKRRLIRDFFILCLSIIIAIYIHNSSFSQFLTAYPSPVLLIFVVIFAGVLFSFTFTVAISTSIFILISQQGANPLMVAMLGGIGSSAGNWVIYRFLKGEVLDDLELIEPKSAKRVAHRILHSKLFIGLVPYLAAIVLISPLPDELGLMMLAGVKFKHFRFFFASIILHAIGILLIVLSARTFA